MFDNNIPQQIAAFPRMEAMDFGEILQKRLIRDSDE